MKRFRNMERNFDGNKLDRVVKILNHLGVKFYREKPIPTGRSFRLPDFIINTEWGDFVLEIDGESVHGLFDMSETEKTTKRNADYTHSGIHYEVFNEGEAKYYKLSWEGLISYLVGKGTQYVKAQSFKYEGKEE
jgi:hypothetical protein